MTTACEPRSPWPDDVETLEASLRLVRPQLAEDLVPASAADDLCRLAAKLAPIHCAGFEVRLGETESAVDLVQRISAGRGEPMVLAEHIAACGLDEEPGWGGIRDFCAAWGLPGSLLQRQVAGAFLEVDAGRCREVDPAGAFRAVDAGAVVRPGRDEAASAPRPPSIYLSLEPGVAAAAGPLRELVFTAGELLRGAPLSERLLDRLQLLCGAGGGGAAATDVGFMLSRRVDALRLVLAPLSLPAALELLDRAGWPGGAADFDAAAALLPAGLGTLALSLDLAAGGVLPRIGLEHYPGDPPDQKAAWRTALDRLVDAGACTPVKRDALLRWPGYLEPDAAAPWPPSLLVESLLNRPDHFSVVARRLTFLKIVCRPGAAPEAKAYFGFGPRSYVPRPEPAAEWTAGPAPPAGAGRPAAVVAGTPHAAAIAAALRFLERERDGDGWWREFPRIMGGTDEWVTAYIGHAAALLPDGRGRRLAEGAWELLASRRSADEGWGYNASLPQDADSTVWGLRLAAALGERRSARARAAARVLARHLVESGGAATYESAAASGLRAFLGVRDLRGLFAAHTCVTAAAAALDAHAARLRPYLAARQCDDGRWRGYWWSDDEYTTALAVEALAAEASRYDACLAAAGRWAATRIDRSGAAWSRGLGGPSAFATALCLRILSVTGTPGGAAAGAALRWLLATQRQDGSWPASALMRMPPTDVADGDARPAATCVSIDDRCLFTTATVMATLHAPAVSAMSNAG